MNNPGLLQIRDQLLQRIHVQSHITAPMLCVLIDNILSKPTATKPVRALLEAMAPVRLNRDEIYNDNDELLFTIGKSITRGGFGLIRAGRYKEHDAVIKVPLHPKSNEPDYNTDIYVLDFIREAIMHIVLYAFQPLFHQCYNIDPHYACITEPYILVKEQTHGLAPAYMLVTQRLDESFHNVTENLPLNQGIVLCIQVALAIYYMQMTLGEFLHDDLSTANVMVKKRPAPVRLQIKLHDNYRFDILTDYELFIIDYGLSCARITNCTKYVNMPAAKFGSHGDKSCLKPTVDLCNFFIRFDLGHPVLNDIRYQIDSYNLCSPSELIKLLISIRDNV